MRKKRRALLGLGVGLLGQSLIARAQQGRTYRIAVLSVRARSTPSRPEPYFGAFVEGMRELGYVEGKNLVIEWRFADDRIERVPALARELVRLNPEVIVSHATQGIQALQAETRAIPIVMTSTSDPIGSGFAKSFARPGGNITGLSLISADLSPKQIELLHSVLPTMSRLAVLVNPTNVYHGPWATTVEAAAQKRGVQMLTIRAAVPDEVDRGFEAMARERVPAVIVATDSFYTAMRKRIAEAGLRHRVAVLTINRENVREGGLMSYGTDVADSYRRAAAYVDRILKGAKPGDLPIEQPTTFRLVVNRKTAKALGLTLPKELVARADEVID
ncbi:MAG TPA: ABC transporter substrate-binding protein [Burkholderiales bacterium]|nr:ABC transporter substrate-binding protein [Burkholderiales bacterium]